MSFKYSLDPSSKKYTCPSCGKKSFVIYIDSESKEAVDPGQFGRCDRENSCAYHKHPSADPQLASQARPENFTPVQEPAAVQIFPDEKLWSPIINRTKTCISPFHAFANKLTIPNDHLLRWGVYSDQDGHGNNLTVYIFRDIQGRICNLKWFKYLDNGHRDKQFNSFSLRQPPRPPQIQRKSSAENEGPATVEKYMLCLFGEHLLDPEKKRTVCVVESEKTVVLASFFYPQFDWVACGSNNGLTKDKVSVLSDRKVIWLCDADKAGRMSKDDNGIVRPSSVRHLIEAVEDFHIADLFQDRNDGYDIGDAIVDGLRPEIKPTWSKGEDPEIKKFASEERYEYDLPDGVSFEKVKDDIHRYMHFEHAGRIYIVRKRKSDGEKGAMYYAQDVTNFTIRSLGLIASETEPTRLVEIKNIYGFSSVVKVPTKAFASPTEFTVFIESVGNFQYDGVGTDLKKIRAKLYDTMLTFDEVETLGWHYTGYFLFANGAYNGKFTPIDKYGFVKLGEKNFFIQPLSCIHRENSEDFEDEKKFVYKEKTSVSLKQWAELFCRVHKDNGRIALAWYISSLFRDFIYQRFKFFPHLFLFGPPGTGKSQVGWSIRSLGFAGLVKPFNLNTGTAVSFHREFAQFKNFPAWCDEYDNSIAYERIQALKAAYDGVGHKKSVKDSDKRTKSTQVNRAILISGQQLPIADNALFKRVVLLQFHQTEYSEAEKKLFTELQQMEEGGLSFITAGFMHFRKDIEEKYYNAFDEVLADMMLEVGKSGFEIEDRIVRNACVILTTIKILQDRIEDRLPYSYLELRSIIIKNVREQMSLINNTNETNTFWDTVMFLARRGEIREGDDYIIEEKKRQKVIMSRDDNFVEFPETTELLFIRFTKILPLYREAFKRQNSSTAAPMDKASLLHYLANSKAYVGLVDNYNFKEARRIGNEMKTLIQRTSCHCFNYAVLKKMGVYMVSDEGVTGTEEPPPLPPMFSANRSDLPF